MMNKKDFARLVARDGYCLHCGETEAVSPNHRINRGMGGSKLLDYPENFVLLCSVLNGQIEADHRWARVAEEYGWKLRSWQNPREIPVYDTLKGEWHLLLSDFRYKVVTHERQQ